MNQDISTDELPLVSVIMPCYNAAPFVKQALESVLKQTYSKLEIILIDDGSTDDTYGILSIAAAVDERIRLFRNDSNMGIVGTLNKALALCNGAYITYMHADDISLIDRIDLLLKFMLRHSDTDIVAAGYCWLDERLRVSAPMIPKTTLPKSIKFTVFMITPMPHPLVFARANVLKKLMYDPTYEYSEDFDLLSRAVLSNHVLRNMDRSLYFIRLNSMRLSFRFENLQNMNHIRISYRNINNYFGVALNPLLNQVIVNRMDSRSSSKQLMESFRIMDGLKNDFLEREECSIPEIEEIEKVVREQKIDILIQSLKFYKWFEMFRLFPMIPSAFSLLINRQVFDYVKGKIVWKIR